MFRSGGGISFEDGCLHSVVGGSVLSGAHEGIKFGVSNFQPGLRKFARFGFNVQGAGVRVSVSHDTCAGVSVSVSQDTCVCCETFEFARNGWKTA